MDLKKGVNEPQFVIVCSACAAHWFFSDFWLDTPPQLPIDADDLEESFGQLWNSWDKVRWGVRGRLASIELRSETQGFGLTLTQPNSPTIPRTSAES